MDTIISVTGLNKTYPSGNVALTGVDLDIRSGEILALLSSARISPLRISRSTPVSALSLIHI